MRQSGNYPHYTSGTLWPPFRLPIATHPSYEDPRKLLLSRTFHAIVFVLLYKAAHTPALVNEQSLALVIYLLDMAVSLAHQSITQGNVRLFAIFISFLSLLSTLTKCWHAIRHPISVDQVQPSLKSESLHDESIRCDGNFHCIDNRRFVSENPSSICQMTVLIFNLVNGLRLTIWLKTSSP